MQNKLQTKKFQILLDWKTLVPTLVLSILGIITLLSTCILPEGGYGDLSIVWKQLLFIGLGLVLYFIISLLDLSYLKYWQILALIYVISIGLLILTLVFGTTVNGAKRWLIIGGFQLQPSEVAKVAMIICTAGIFSMKDKFSEVVLILLSAFSTIGILILTYLEPAGSMTILIFTIWFIISFLALSNPIRNTVLLIISGTLLAAGLLSSITGTWEWLLLSLVSIILLVFVIYSKNNWKKVAIIFFILGVLLGIGAYKFQGKLLHDYQTSRINAFLNPDSSENDASTFNVKQSKIAIGSGEIIGKGFGNGTQSKRNFLPEHQTDFIFASFAEEFGLLGSLLVFGLYGFLIIHCFIVGINTMNEPIYSLISIGIGIKILLELFINIGTNLGVIPATGIPLPLMSAGGTITLMTFACLGIIQNISVHYSNQEKERSSDIIQIYED